MGLRLDEGQWERLRDLQSLVVLLVDLDATIVPLAESVRNTLLFYGIGTSVFELEAALDIMLEIIEEVVEGLSLRRAIVSV